ncbi:uncharacterized protein YALI1_F04855g [Yarrowia lipolytica]|uniref:Uncharacterized protein n=1 Tax=Yarrowia lipolytica TaxID=4952 RepID=A0A1D8NLU4_YARLL|nr:hypothetical protein YALI1_F04855g [Yarrowia lipolytica]
MTGATGAGGVELFTHMAYRLERERERERETKKHYPPSIRHCRYPPTTIYVQYVRTVLALLVAPVTDMTHKGRWNGEIERGNCGKLAEKECPGGVSLAESTSGVSNLPAAFRIY